MRPIVEPVGLVAGQCLAGRAAAANPNQRAALVVRAEELALQQLPWIPDVQPDMVPVLGKSLSGSVSSSTYLFSLWADQLGGTG